MDDEREARIARQQAALARARAILDKPAPTVEPPKTTAWGERSSPAPHYEQRLERFVQGDRRALDGWMDEEPVPMPEVLNEGQKQVRAAYEQARPVLDPETMKLWDAWAERIIWRELQQHLIPDMLKIIHDESDDLNEHTVKDITATDEILRQDIRNMRWSMAKQLRNELIAHFGDDLTSMKEDVLNVLRAELGLRGSNVVDLPNPLSRKA